MSIRKARIDDEDAIVKLMDQLGYEGTDAFLRNKMLNIFINPNVELVVYEVQKEVVAFMAIDIITQLGLEGDFARISYFIVDNSFRGKRIGRQMEEYCVAYARKRKCDRIELHCHDRRKDAHQFYLRHGYRESPKYFTKPLNAKQTKAML